MKYALSLLLILMSSSAFAGVHFSVMGAGIYGLNKSTPAAGVEVKGDLGFGGGAAVGFGLGGRTSFELGALYLMPKAKATATVTLLGQTVSSSTTTTGKGLYIPAVFLVGLGPIVHLELGGFYNKDLQSGGVDDYGAQAGIRLHTLGSSPLFCDISYSMGMKDVAGSKSKGVLGLIGMTFGK